MALYSYQAFTKDGKKIKGVIDAPSANAVREQLAQKGLFPIKIEPAQEGAREGLFGRFFTRSVSVKEKILFTKQLATLLKSGVPLLQALELLIDQVEGRLRTIVINVKDDVKEGSSLADALAKYPNVFETIYVQLVKAGEASGNLEVILDRLTDYLGRREEIRKQVVGAIRYPLIQLIVAGLVVVGLIVFVIPGIAEGLASQDQPLPTITMLMMNIANFVKSYYLLILIALIILVAAFQYWRKTPQGARALDNLTLRLPLIRYIAKTSAVVQFSYTLGLLLNGGVNLSDALDIVVAIIDNRILTDTLNEARDKIIKQGKIAQYLKQTDIFPPVAIYLIKTGEETGKLDTMLLTVAENYEEELRELINKLTGALGPLMLVVVALFIGLIVLSIMTPVLNMMGQAGGAGF